MKNGLMVIAAFAALVAPPALAADMALKASPLPPPAPIWTGWYVGANGGGGWAHTDWNFPTAQFFDTAAGQGFGTTPSGGLAGGQFGYNYQIGPWVVGGEFTGDWSGLSETLVGPVTPVFPFDSYTTKLYDLETFTFRGGYAPGNWFWYGKAGVATGTINLSGVSGAPVPGVAFSNTQRQWGPTVGAGVEFMWMRHIVVGVEYDFTALSRESINTTATCSVLATCSVVPSTPVSVNGGTFTLSSVVGRLSYKFDWLPAPIAPRY